MDVTMADSNRLSEMHNKKLKNRFNLRSLRLSLKYRPEILKLILKMRRCIKKKSSLLKKIKQQLKLIENATEDCNVASTQIDNYNSSTKNITDLDKTEKKQTQNKIDAFSQTDEVFTFTTTSATDNENMSMDALSANKTHVQHASTQTDDASTSNSSNKRDNKETPTTTEDEIDVKYEPVAWNNKGIATNSAPGIKNMQIDDQLANKTHTSTQTEDASTSTSSNKGDTQKTLTTTEDETEVKKEPAACNIKGNTTKSAADNENMQIDNHTANKTNVLHTSTQTEDITTSISSSKADITETVTTAADETEVKKEPVAWNIKGSEEGKSIADQVKEAAQSALQQTGMVYVESARMYYDYKTGYYYNSELGLYYHTDTGCYYLYSDDKKEFVFHSYPDRSALAANASFNAHERRKARKHKKASKMDEEVDSLTKNLSQDKEEDEASKPKRKKLEKKKITKKSENNDENAIKPQPDTDLKETEEVSHNKDAIVEKEDEKEIENGTNKEDLEDGECSKTDTEKSDTEEESDASTSTASDDDTIAKHHPPCMRVIVRETNLPKLKVGSLYLVTKDGGTVGREGDHHTILLRDHNVSRNHLDIKYDMDRRMYLATDLGSKNGTVLNGVQMSESQVTSKPMEVVHGSTIQLGETKLLCHIHAGNDTCGHCEPGLLMETQEKEKAAYTRTCSVQKQYQLELARLKNKYTPEPLMIEEGTYNDRAKARRETVGSSHHSVKTQSSDVDTFIAPENKGFKLLEKMGWAKGEGLGKERQGDTEPIPLVTNEGKAGLGTPGSVSAPLAAPPPKPRNTLGPATLRLATRSKLLKPPAKVFQDPLDDDSE